ncbi:MAG: hypothetical protein Athens071416_79 [Parcubacteria group bacterium Athens0714_16]|nr:MAG: hypothetical protein Athens071416_79 [Parcubacteria group bacterium Athens0714_16]
MESNKPKLNVGFFFLCLGLLITLITSVTSFLNLVFETLNKNFPDVLNASYQYGYSLYEYESIRIALATLIIFFPVFIVVSYFWRKYAKGIIGHTDEVIKKWVTYIILFLSTVVIMVDLVTLIRYFISGEITTRFILKVIIALVVAGLVGAYYIFLLREKNSSSKTSLIFAIVGAVLVIGAVIFSFMIMGSPSNQRKLRMDDRRIGDLQSIQYQVIYYWQSKEKLPEKLSDLANPISGYSLPVDPEFEKGNTYEYFVKDKLKFELCATFSLPIPKGWVEYSNGGGVMPMMDYYYGKDVSVASRPYPAGGVNESWDHKEGKTCFERTIDKDLYPPYPKPLLN